MKKILTKEITKDFTQYDNLDYYKTFTKKKNHAKIIVRDPTKDHVSD